MPSLLLKTISECPRNCSIEHMDYYRCLTCQRDFIVRSGDDNSETDDTRHDLIRAAYGWVGEAQVEPG